MDRREKSSLEEEISHIVESALESCDFKKLSQSIESTVGRALDQVGRNVSQAGKIIQDSFQKERCEKTEQTFQREKSGQAEQTFQREKSGQAEQARNREKTEQSRQAAGGQANTGTGNVSGASGPGSRAANLRRLQRDRYASNGGMKSLAVVMTVAGFAALGFFGLRLILSLVGVAFGAALGLAEWVWMGTPGFLALAGAVLGAAGIRFLRYNSRFRGYVAQLGQREFCDIQELVDSSGKSRKYVLKDLRRMIRDHLFRQGHLDSQGTCLMVTDQAYGQYQAALQGMQQRQKAQEQQRQSAEEQQSGEAWENQELSQEARKVIQEGNRYLEQIRRSNEAIPGTEISGKISRMELVIGKIFERVERHPELVEDLRKFMEYYLPTTVKLLGAYEEMDAMPVQGPNIVNSKKEIEDTLDIINQAFENLLDSFFEDTAWDISTDISVFKTMLAQEGLTGSEFGDLK